MTIATHYASMLDPVLLFERAFGLVPHPWQVEYLREVRPTIVLKGRQVGASLSAAALAIHTALFWPDSVSAIVSPTQKQSSEITTRARAGLKALAEPLAQDSASMLRLANGSRILSLPGSPKSVRGWSARLLIIDEAAFVDPETFTAARALVATGGRLLLQSTPAKQQGDFFEAVRDNDPEWAHFRVPSSSVSTISPAFLAGERRAMSPDAFAAEFECEFGRGAGASLFSVDRLRDLILKEQPE